MIVYMIQDQKTGRWCMELPMDYEWVGEQKNGFVFTREQHVKNTVGYLCAEDNSNEPVVVEFLLSRVNESIPLSTIYVDKNNERWHYEEGTWFWGDQSNGCGVYEDRKGWNRRVSINNEVHIFDVVSTREDAMTKATTFFREKTNEK